MPFRGRRGRSGNAVLAALAILLVLVVLFAGVYFYVLPVFRHQPSPCPVPVLCPAKGPGVWKGQTNAVWIADYNSQMVQMTESNLSQYLRPGDGIALVMNNLSNWPAMNGAAQTLSQKFPDLLLRAYSGLDGGTGTAGGLSSSIGQLSPLFTQVSADYEVNGPLEFNPNGTWATTYFSNFSSIVHSAAPARFAIGYPSGRGVLGDYSGPPDNWNYGEFQAKGGLDGMTVETQMYCMEGYSEWEAAAQRLVTQYESYGLNLHTLSVQISVGGGGNGALYPETAFCASYWIANSAGSGNIFIWWSPSELGQVIQLLQSIGR